MQSVSGLTRELTLVQNPALGAILLWRFVVGYTNEQSASEPCPLPLLFLVLPIIFHRDMLEIVSSIQSGRGLRAFSEKLVAANQDKKDLLLSIHDQCKEHTENTLDSFSFAVRSNLLAIDHENGRVFYVTKTVPFSRVPDSVAPMLKGAERLGHWCAKVSLHEVTTILRVSF